MLARPPSLSVFTPCGLYLAVLRVPVPIAAQPHWINRPSVTAADMLSTDIHRLWLTAQVWQYTTQPAVKQNKTQHNNVMPARPVRSVKPVRPRPSAHSRTFGPFLGLCLRSTAEEEAPISVSEASQAGWEVRGRRIKNKHSCDTTGIMDDVLNPQALSQI